MVKILVTFTYGYSLKTWQESGTLDREISIYLQLQKKFGHEYVFLTYGNESDKKFDLKGLRVEILPIYSYINYSKYKSVNLMRSLLFPFFNKKMFQDIELIKQNQLLGSWVSLI